MGYRETMTVRAGSDANHPLNKGVKMQAHHLISKKGVNLAFLKDELEHLGYDINVWENLVLLPCTLKGACHLKVQLHRGNHTAPVEAGRFGLVDADDDDVALSYHGVVAGLLLTVKTDIDRGEICKPGRDLQSEIDKLSRKMFLGIKSFTIPLTSIARSFVPLKGFGCGGVDSTPEAKAKRDAAEKGGPKPVCPRDRDHLGQEGIKWKSLTGMPWDLEIGK
jgi:hypothetical protein